MAQKKSKQNSRHKDVHLTKICTYLIWAGVFLSLLVPLMIKTDLFYPFFSYRSLWLMGTVQFIFTVWVFLAYHNSKYRPELNLVVIVLSLFLVSMTLSTIFGADPANSFWSNYERMTGLLMHLHLFAYFLILTSFFKTEEEWQKFLSLAVGVAVLVSIWGIADYYNIYLILHAYNLLGIVSINVAEANPLGGSTIGQPTFMGAYLLINTFFSLYLILKAKGIMSIIHGLAFMILASGIILNPAGRAMRGALVIGLVIFTLLNLIFRLQNKYINTGVKVIFASGIFAFIYIGYSAFLEGSFVRNIIMGLHGMPGRLANWDSAWLAIKKRPVLGWGPENFDIALYQNYDPRVMLRIEGFVGEPWHDRAHNIIFDYLVATGMLGTLFFLGLLGCALFVFWKAHLIEKRIDFWAPGVFTTLIAAYLIQNLTNFDTVNTYMLVFALLAFAASLTKKNQVPGEKKAQIAFGFPSIGLIAILITIFIISFNNFVYKPYQAASYAGQALRGSHNIPLIENYSKAIETSPMGRQQLRRYLAQKSIQRINQVMHLKQDDIYAEEVEFMINEVQKSTKESPLQFRRYFTLGELCIAYLNHLRTMAGEDGMLEKARNISLMGDRAFTKAIKLSPKGIQAYWGLAEVKVNQGIIFAEPERFIEALSVLEQAKEIEPRFYTSHEKGMIIALILLQDRDLALEIFEKAIEVNPTWEDALRNIILGHYSGVES